MHKYVDFAYLLLNTLQGQSWIKLQYRSRKLRDLSEISRGEEGGGVETEGGSQLFETAEKEGVMKNGPLKGGGLRKHVSVIM